MTGRLADVRTDSSMRSSSKFCVLVSSKMASGVVSTLSSVGLPPLPAVVSAAAVRPNGPDIRRRRCRWADEVKRGEWTAALWNGDVGWRARERARDDGAWKACADGGPPIRPMATTAAAALFRLVTMIRSSSIGIVQSLPGKTPRNSYRYFLGDDRRWSARWQIAPGRPAVPKKMKREASPFRIQLCHVSGIDATRRHQICRKASPETRGDANHGKVKVAECSSWPFAPPQETRTQPSWWS